MRTKFLKKLSKKNFDIEVNNFQCQPSAMTFSGKSVDLLHLTNFGHERSVIHNKVDSGLKIKKY